MANNELLKMMMGQATGQPTFQDSMNQLAYDPLMNAGMAMMNAGGPSLMPVSTGQAMAKGFQGLQKGVQAQDTRKMKALELMAAMGKGDSTSLMKNLKSMGYVEGTPAWNEIVQKVLMRPDTQLTLNQGPKLQTDHMWNDPDDPSKGVSVIPDSPTAIERQNLQKQSEAAEAQEKQNAQLVTMDLDRALTQSEGLGATGWQGALTKSLAGTPAYDLSRTLDGIKARIGFGELQRMRKNSPTGGALGSVSEMENRLLQSVMGSLEQSQSHGDFVSNLKRIKAIFGAIVHGTMAIPKNNAEWSKIPVGTSFIDPGDGMVYIKEAK